MIITAIFRQNIDKTRTNLYNNRKQLPYSKGVFRQMNLLMIIFGLIAICGVLGIVQSIRERNVLALVFNAGAAAIFGWFVVMTLVSQGFPPKLH